MSNLKRIAIFIAVSAAGSVNAQCPIDIKSSLASIQNPQLRSSVQGVTYQQISSSVGGDHDALIVFLESSTQQHQQRIDTSKDALRQLGVSTSVPSSPITNPKSMSDNYRAAIQLSEEAIIINNAWKEIAECNIKQK